MPKFVLNLWNKIPDAGKIKIISIANTFASTFILILATGVISADTIAWTAAFWGGLISIAGREAVKAVISLFVPAKLGGRKK